MSLSKQVVITDVPPVQFVTNTVIPIDIPREGKIFEGRVILEGQITITGATVFGTPFGAGPLAELIEYIRIRATPADGSRYPGGVVVDASPRALLLDAMINRGQYLAEVPYSNYNANLSSDGTLANAGKVGTYNVYLAIPVIWRDEAYRKNLKLAFNADPSAFKSIRLEIKTRDLAGALPGNNGTLNVTGLKIRWQDERAIVGGDSFVQFITEHNNYIPGVRSRHVMKELPNDGAFLRMMVWTCTNAANTKTVSDAILNKLWIDTQQRTFQIPATDIRQRMFDQGWLTVGQTATGLYLLDFADGQLTDPNSAGLAQDASALTSGNAMQWDVNNPSGAGLDSINVLSKRIFAPYNMDQPQKAS